MDIIEIRKRQNDAFRAYLKGRPEEEVRDLLTGTQSVTYTQGAAGGFTVPQDFYNDLIIGIAQVDPLFDPKVTTVIQSDGYDAKPIPVPGWDLATITATRIGEGIQQVPGAVPQAAGKVLNGYPYKITLAASWEIEDDSFMPITEMMKRAYAVAFARGIGVDLILGTGIGQPQGVLAGAANSGVTTLNSGQFVIDDFNNIYTSVDRVYRQSNKCAWLMSDSTYKAVRNARDNSGRPLLDQSHDRERILDKPVYVSPSVPFGSGQKGVIFGDLSHVVVRLTQLVIQRSMQSGAGPGSVERGEALYHGRMRADSIVFNPTPVTSPQIGLPPVVYATLK